ncbi:centriole, cilia and spindle-associated protein [Denticeps clupeoides]|uniref:Centriole, cilia and spindle-associated protein n=1 Tax=Denticeps clupeoides TaxID=299321 RepID=A0AAY4CLY8_9TELE|nr:centriole, cilia and spindle-associated protein [Denticeps clupeoides]
MVTKRTMSEYMKKFKDPKWETYSKCYEELLKYRMTRRLLEQSHNPWFWGGSETDSNTSGKSTPQRRNVVEPLQLKDESPTQEDTIIPAQGKQEPNEGEAKEETANVCNLLTSQDADQPVAEAEPSTKKKGRKENRKKGAPAIPLLRKASTMWQNNKSTRTRDASQEPRHPFALYGWAERYADVASKKTYSVCPARSTKEIHESAMRAKTRREIEKKMKKGKCVALSADLDKLTKATLFTDYDPWMTEYMRCFSARSR